MCKKEEMDEILSKPILDYKDIAKLLSVSTPTAYKWIYEINCYLKTKDIPPLMGKRVRPADFKEYMRM